MPISSLPLEGPQEPSPSQSENDNPTLVSRFDLPDIPDIHGNFDIQQHYPNFFVLSSLTTNNSTFTTTQQPTASKKTYARQHIPAELAHTSTSTELTTPPSKANTILINHSILRWLRILFTTLGLTAVSTSHAINMFFYPRYAADEGVYTMYAWAITRGQIAPYAYGYGHPPLAWMQIAAWMKLTGGFFTFGNAINSGRVLMLLITIISAWLIYAIAYQLQLNFFACLFAMLAFALSPLAITFQRQVLLDNFATFWFLLALYLILIGKSRLFYTITAGICFGFALLSKEVLIILFPVMVYVVWLYSTKFQRTFQLVAFFYTVLALGSTFILMAILNGELFPYEWHLPGDTHPHLSLIGIYLLQTGRGQNEGSIYDSWAAWIACDPILITIGIAIPLFNLILGWWKREHLFLALFAIIFWGLLLRGGVVFAFYIIPLIPLIAINTAIFINTIAHWLSNLLRFKQLYMILPLAALLVALIPYDLQRSLSPKNVFTLRPTVAQNEALTWIHAHVPRQSVVIINSNLFTDLHEHGGKGVGNGTVYPYAHVYWFAALDPEVHDQLLHNDWNRIDYIVVDSEMNHDIQNYGQGMNMIKTALAHAVLRVSLSGDDGELMQIYQVIHHNTT